MKPRHRGAAITVALVASLAGACTDELPGEATPDQALYFPIGVETSLDGRYAYVLSSNFDQLYQSGWVSVIDVAAALAGADQGAIIQKLNLPSLGGGLALDQTGGLLVATHRSNSLLSLIEVSDAGARVSCGDPAAEEGLSTIEELTDCDAAHLYRLRPQGVDDALERADFEDPFSITHVVRRPGAGQEERMVAVGYLSDFGSGQEESPWLRLTLLDVAGGVLDQPVQLANQRTTLVSTGGAIRTGSVSSLAVHPDPTGNYLLAGTVTVVNDVNDRRAGVAYSIDLARLAAQSNQAIAGSDLSSQLGGAEIQSVVFSPDGALAFAASESPDSISVLDASLATFQVALPDGSTEAVVRPRLDVLGAVALEGRPGGMAYVPRATGPDLLAVTSQPANAIFVFAVEANELTLAARLEEGIGEGPYTVRATSLGGRDILLVSTFIDHGLTLVDVTAADPASWPVARVRDEAQPVTGEVP